MILKKDRLIIPDECKVSAEEIEYDHCMDISGSVYTRMAELGMTQKELADATDMDPAQISRIIKGTHNLTIRTLARLEEALDFRLDQGFRYRAVPDTLNFDNVIDFRSCRKGRLEQEKRWHSACAPAMDVEVN